MSDSECSSPAQEPTDARKEHERALGRERARRFRERKRNGNGVAISTDVPLPGARRLMQVANAMARGVSGRQALKDAGYNPTSQCVKDAAMSLLQAELAKQAVGVATVISSVKEGLEATSPMLTSGGSIERPDWSARAAGRRDAIALLDRAGELPAAQASSVGTQYNVQILQFGSMQGLTNGIHKHESQAIDVSVEKHEDESDA